MYVDPGAVKDAIEKALAKREETGRLQVVYLEAPAASGKSTAIRSTLETYEGTVSHVANTQLSFILENLKKHTLIGKTSPDVVIVEDDGESDQSLDVLKELAALPPEELHIRKKSSATIVQWNPVIVYQAQRCCEHVPDSFVVQHRVQPIPTAPSAEDPPPPYTAE